MDITPVDTSFYAPLSPLSKGYTIHPNGDSKPGQKLFDMASDFYAWYLSWDRDPKEHSLSFQTLSQIMQIAQVSASGGEYLSEQEEIGALTKLSQLKEKLFDGNLKPEHILSKLLDVLQSLVHSNPKSRLVAQATAMEFVFCLHPVETKSQEFIKSLQRQLGALVEKITPKLLDLHAHAIAQGLSKILENPAAVPNPHHRLTQAVGHWLD